MGRTGPTLPSRFLSEVPVEVVGGKSANVNRSLSRTPVVGDVWRTDSLGEVRKPSIADSFRVGDSVRHAVFGEGVVMDLNYENNDCLLTIQFSGDLGTKRLLLSFAPLEKIED